MKNGLQYKDAKIGSGKVASEGDRVVMDWEGYTIGEPIGQCTPLVLFALLLKMLDSSSCNLSFLVPSAELRSFIFWWFVASLPGG